MALRRSVLLGASFGWTFGAIYGVEALANTLYLGDSQAFFAVSGLRLAVLVGTCVFGSVAAGWVVKDFAKAAAVQMAAVLAFLSLVYVVCDPRLCYSTGADGLEPARLGILLLSCAVAGTYSGAPMRRPGTHVGAEAIAFGLCTFIALAFFPVSFYFAGTRLLGLSEPYALVTALVAASACCGAVIARVNGWKAGVSITTTGASLLIVLSTPMAVQYLPYVAPGALAGFVGAVAGAFAGSIVGLEPKSTKRYARFATVAFVLALLLDLGMTLVILPDATTATDPGAGVAALPPAYVGGYMDSAPGHAVGVSVNVSFAGTDPAAIQADNYLAGGVGVHGAGCCVDGIDYAYRFDAYMFHNGTVWLAATGWEACDDNAACGGHSWKTLMFQRWGQMKGANEGTSVVLTILWSDSVRGPVVNWYAGDSRTELLFASFVAPPAENQNFNIGVLRGGSGAWEQSASYFFQFGVTSAYPIGHGGWNVHFTCPETLPAVQAQACLSHFKTVQGSDSFWKVIWRWGEDYPNAGIATTSDTVSFSQSNQTISTGAVIW